MANSKIEKQIEELKEEIKELENINSDKMINVEDEIQNAKTRLKNLERMAEGNLTAWEKVEIARSQDRPTALDYINDIFDEFMELHGDRSFADDKSMVCGLARIGDQNYTVIAEQKGRNTKENIERNFGMPNPESYRKGVRFMKQAEKFKRPIVTFIDTKGAYPGVGAEERGQGEAIARSMFTMANLKTPIIAIVIGEGSSGGALAIGVGDKILMLENAIYSILSPEGYASIVWKDNSRKEEAAEKMKLTADDLLELNVIDEIVKEPEGGADKDSASEIALELKNRIIEITKELSSKDIDVLLEERYQKFRNIGQYIREEN